MKTLWGVLLLHLSISSNAFSISPEKEYIYQLLDLYERPITFLAITDDEAFIRNLSIDYQGVFVHIHPNKIDDYKDYPLNYIHLQKKMSNEDLIHLEESEHFDVVYIKAKALKDKKCAQTLYHLGEHVFVWVLNSEKKFHKMIHKVNFLPVYTSQFRGDIMYFAKHKIAYNKRTQWLQPPSHLNAVRVINSTFASKTLEKRHEEPPSISAWIPGINLMTFKMLNGRYPNANTLMNEIGRLYYIPHLDWMPNNIVIQGCQLKLIDFDDPETSNPKTVHTETMLSLMLEFVSELDSKKIPGLFDAILHYNRTQIHPEYYY